MVSGVGPSATLANYNISVLADRPGVGQNMWVCQELHSYPQQQELIEAPDPYIIETRR